MAGSDFAMRESSRAGLRRIRGGRPAWTRLICPVALLAASGCGGDSGAPRRVAVFPVTGSILRADGKPLSGGQVYFVPRNGVLTSEGKIGSDGSFTLVTGNSGEGAPPGDFKVRIEPSDPSLIAGKRSRTTGKGLPFPSHYLDEDTSGLTASIKAEPNTLGPFRLK